MLEWAMKLGERLLLAVVIVLVDLVVFAVPLTAFYVAYLLVARPPWFKEWVTVLYSDA